MFRGKLKCSSDVQKTASARLLVEMEMLDCNPTEFVPNPSLLARMVNRKREKERPNQPKEDDLDCEISISYLNIPEDFQLADIKIEGLDGRTVARHIIYASPTQIGLLRRAETLFMDGIFKSVKNPFRQLFGVHAFVRCGEAVKQVPLVTVLMTRATKVDYNAVWKELLQKAFGGEAVREAVLDFEIAAWISLRENLPNIQIHGCLFHYSQAIFEE